MSSDRDDGTGGTGRQAPPAIQLTRRGLLLGGLAAAVAACVRNGGERAGSGVGTWYNSQPGDTLTSLSRRTGTVNWAGSDYSSVRYPGYLAIVGVSPTPTTVTLAAAGAIQADVSGRIAATPRGGTLTFTINRGEVAHVTAAPPPECVAGRPGFHHVEACETIPVFGQTCDMFDTCAETDHDLTGTRITATGPIEVFGGHTCAYAPYYAQACDHLEEQLPPVETWGTDYVGAPLGDGGLVGTNIVRVIAGFDGTTVTVTPPQVKPS